MPTAAESYLLNAIQQIADQEPNTPQGKLARTALVQHATVYGDRLWNAAEQGPGQNVDPVVGNITSTDDATGHG